MAPVWGLKFETESENGTQNQRGRRLNNDARHTWSQRGSELMDYYLALMCGYLFYLNLLVV